ncbi:MAG: citrate synthase [Thermoplasmata archaeon]|nr:citrate synthase [Thermoplasmata archaeon]
MAKQIRHAATTVALKPKRVDVLRVVDGRTAKEYSIPIQLGAIHAPDLRQIRVSDEDFGLMSYDPSFLNTASCKSSVTFIDGATGTLRYRGYPIEELAGKRNYLEVAYLLVNGRLPGKNQLADWLHNITYHTMLHENVKKFMDGFHHDAHPMGMLVSTLAGLSTFYPEAKEVQNVELRQRQIHRLIAKMPTLAAFAYRHSIGMAYIYPSNDLGYAENLLAMMYRPSWTTDYTPDPVLSKVLDLLFVLHADHEQNCSTQAMRTVGSSHADPYTCSAAAAAALYGPLHGGANEQVIQMLREVGSKENIPKLIRQVKGGRRLLMGFGHRIYKNRDPRAEIIKKVAGEVFAVTGRNPLLDVALELEKVAESDDYFIKRHLFPNVDFYSGIIYQSMGFPVDMFPVLFAIPRMSGWLAQWQEMLLDPEQKISRPRQLYVGPRVRHLPAAPNPTPPG